MRFGHSQGGKGIHARGGDRRLSTIQLVRADGSVSEDVQTCHLVYEDEKMDGWDHVQYMGEHMVRGYPLM